MLEASEEMSYIVFDVSKFFLQRFGEFGDGVGPLKEHVDQVFPEHFLNVEISNRARLVSEYHNKLPWM